jgi:hypothetical protein
VIYYDFLLTNLFFYHLDQIKFVLHLKFVLWTFGCDWVYFNFCDLHNFLLWKLFFYHLG